MFRILALSLLISSAMPVMAQEKDFFFRKGDRILFLGDSITEQYQYSTYIELYLTTRFPEWNLSFLNAGIGGDTANGGFGRFQTHVLNEKPTAITINFGMNDAGYGAFNKGSNDNYVNKTSGMVELAKKAGIRVGLVSPNAVDRRVNQNFKLYVETQKQFYAPLKEIAKKYEVSHADQYALTRAAVEEMEKTDPKAEKVKPYYDGFHTSPSGGLLMAHSILKELHAPALVSSVSVDATTGTAKAENATVEKVQKSDKGVTFTRLDKALPIPVQKEWESVLPFISNLKDLNNYSLQVSGLSEGTYAVSIDGVVVGNFSEKDLSAGVNLGNVTTGPIYAQAQKVFAAINTRNQLVKSRFFDVVRFSPNLPGWLADVKPMLEERRLAELEKRTKVIEASQEAIHKLATPTAHEFKVEKKS